MDNSMQDERGIQDMDVEDDKQNEHHELTGIKLFQVNMKTYSKN